MSEQSNNQGRAYEYICVLTLFDEIQKIRPAIVQINSALNANANAWNSISPFLQNILTESAKATTATIFDMEPMLLEEGEDMVVLTCQTDKEGKDGDVRDIVITRKDVKWEIGLSIKHNHSAVKHSRLSHVLDFGNEWYGIPCSEQYWIDIAPVFSMLNFEKNRGTNWSDLTDKENDVYVPILNAFLDEVNRAYSNDPNVAIRMFEYLVGIKDYHKIVSHDNKRLTLIHTFNLHGTLGKQSNVKFSAFDLPMADIPTEILAMRFKKGSKTTVEIYMDNGWAFSFRIHSASTRIQPSLKFDVQFISTPPSVLHIECKWNKTIG